MTPLPESPKSVFEADESSETLLWHALEGRLSASEKEARDRELLESAEKYFGGLAPEEKKMLGLVEEPPAQSAAEPSLFTEASETLAASEDPLDRQAVLGVWLRAGISAVIFAGIAAWVLSTR